jgi:hypothetical protein
MKSMEGVLVDLTKIGRVNGKTLVDATQKIGDDIKDKKIMLKSKTYFKQIEANFVIIQHS